MENPHVPIQILYTPSMHIHTYVCSRAQFFKIIWPGQHFYIPTHPHTHTPTYLRTSNWSLRKERQLRNSRQLQRRARLNRTKESCLNSYMEIAKRKTYAIKMTWAFRGTERWKNG